ncbi:MAG TPA: hypothetical protein VJO34_15155 [Methylomirabilota bacterium]|nr:hypothetical protein [Methylomirabilota bacterium]
MGWRTPVIFSESFRATAALEAMTADVRLVQCVHDRPDNLIANDYLITTSRWGTEKAWGSRSFLTKISTPTTTAVCAN